MTQTPLKISQLERIISKKIVSLILVLLTVFFASNLFAETRYVNDEIIISVRTGPGKDYKIIKTIKTGTAMTVLEDKGEFIKVKTVDGLTGWVPKYYTNHELPKEVIIQQLTKELQSKKDELLKCEDNRTQISNEAGNKNQDLIAQTEELRKIKIVHEQTINKLTETLDALELKHSSLLEQSRDILKTTTERNQLNQTNIKLGGAIKKLKEENKSLGNYQLIYWFLAGGGVLLLGWILGNVSKNKRTRTISL